MACMVLVGLLLNKSELYLLPIAIRITVTEKLRASPTVALATTVVSRDIGFLFSL